MIRYTKVKLGDICRIEKGRTGIASAVPGEYPLVVTAEERKICDEYQFDCEAVCIPLVSSSGHGKKSLKNVHYQSGKFALGSILCAVIPNNPQEVNARYLHQYLQFYKDTLLVPLMKGAANVSLSMRDIAKVEIPLPDFDTQAALAKTFVEAQKKQKLLDAEFEKQTEYAKRLRQNILQEAIEGKLTAEWRKTHPAEKGNPDFDAQALFEQIQKEKCHTDSILLTQNQKKKHKGKSLDFPNPCDNDYPSEIPESWKWVRLGEIGNWASGATPIKSETLYYSNGTIPWLRTGDLNDNSISSVPMFITDKALKECSLRLNPIGTVLIAMYGATIGRVGILEIEAATNQACCACIPYQKNFSYYLFYLLISLRKKFKEMSWGAAQPNISKEIIIKTLFPLPPLAEQKEIVAKVESLLAEVTELENQIQKRKKLSELLMQSVLKNAFNRKN